MTVFLVDIDNNEINKLCLNVLCDYFKKHKIKYFVLTDRIYDRSPVWYKLRCFDHINDDFVLCWDLDLLPKKNSDSICNYLDFNKINLAVDTSVDLPVSPLTVLEFFRYNCGLMGIPRAYKAVCEQLFQEPGNRTSPLYERLKPGEPHDQDIINEYLYNRNFSDVHEIDSRWNTLYYLQHNVESILKAKAIHYTSHFIKDKLPLIQKHFKSYFN